MIYDTEIAESHGVGLSAIRSRIKRRHYLLIRLGPIETYEDARRNIGFVLSEAQQELLWASCYCARQREQVITALSSWDFTSSALPSGASSDSVKKPKGVPRPRSDALQFSEFP